MAKKWKHRTYCGALNKPIKYDRDQWSVWEWEATDNPVKAMEATARIEAEIIQKFTAKMPLLFDEYNIPRNDPDRWERLAGALAYAHVPGFSGSHVGAPTKWDPFIAANLVLDVERSRADISIDRNCDHGAVSTTDSIKRLVRKDPAAYGKNVSSIHKRYDEGLKKAADVLRIAIKQGKPLLRTRWVLSEK